MNWMKPGLLPCLTVLLACGPAHARSGPHDAQSQVDAAPDVADVAQPVGLSCSAVRPPPPCDCPCLLETYAVKPGVGGLHCVPYYIGSNCPTPLVACGCSAKAAGVDVSADGIPGVCDAVLPADVDIETIHPYARDADGRTVCTAVQQGILVLPEPALRIIYLPLLIGGAPDYNTFHMPRGNLRADIADSCTGDASQWLSSDATHAAVGVSADSVFLHAAPTPTVPAEPACRLVRSDLNPQTVVALVGNPLKPTRLLVSVDGENAPPVAPAVPAEVQFEIHGQAIPNSNLWNQRAPVVEADENWLVAMVSVGPCYGSVGVSWCRSDWGVMSWADLPPDASHACIVRSAARP